MRWIGMAAALAMVAGTAEAGVLDRAKETGELRIAYRDDAQPFSYKNADGEPAGYSVAPVAKVRSEKSMVARRAKVAVVASHRMSALPSGTALSRSAAATSTGTILRRSRPTSLAVSIATIRHSATL